jgi:hypothetical protein
MGISSKRIFFGNSTICAGRRASEIQSPRKSTVRGETIARLPRMVQLCSPQTVTCLIVVINICIKKTLADDISDTRTRHWTRSCLSITHLPSPLPISIISYCHPSHSYFSKWQLIQKFPIKNCHLPTELHVQLIIISLISLY